MPSPAIAHFSKADLWYCEQISDQRGDRVYHNHLLNIAHQSGSGYFSFPELNYLLNNSAKQPNFPPISQSIRDLGLRFGYLGTEIFRNAIGLWGLGDL
jgi:hypothetical protein